MGVVAEGGDLLGSSWDLQGRGSHAGDTGVQVSLSFCGSREGKRQREAL